MFMNRLSSAWVFFLVFLLLTVREGLRVKPDDNRRVSKALYCFSRWFCRKFYGWLVSHEAKGEDEKRDSGE